MAADDRALEQKLYYRYAEVIDDGRLVEWPAFFTEGGIYEIRAKENHDRGLPLCLMSCKGRGMLVDRADASANLNVFAPRTWRHLVTNICISRDGERVTGKANFMVMETIGARSTHVLVSGRYIDEITETNDEALLKRRTVVYDTALVPGSIVFPL